jgi:hypothetical protein
MSPPPPPKRIQSATERDMAGLTARKEREAAPCEVNPETSSNYEGPELKDWRSKRPTDKRVERLEEKYDELADKVSAIHGDVREMRGELKTALSLFAPERKEVHTTERHRIDSRTKVIIAIVGAAGTAVGIIATALSGCA